MGQWGEDQAAAFLQARGFRILARNYQTPLGELDVIAEDGTTIVFVEVKYRSTDLFGSGGAAVTPTKQRRLLRAALVFLKRQRWTNRPTRFDVFLTGSEQPTWIPHAFSSDGHYTV